MSHLTIAFIVAAVIVILTLLLVRIRYRRSVSELDYEHFESKWKSLQKFCATRKTWPKAIVAADDLLDEALRQRRYKGKSTGERLVAAQHQLTANEEVWFGHKMRDSIVTEDVRRLKKQDIIDALAGFRQALKDLGALRP